MESCRPTGSPKSDAESTEKPVEVECESEIDNSPNAESSNTHEAQPVEVTEETKIILEIDVESEEEMKQLREEELSLTEEEKNVRRVEALEVKNSANAHFKAEDYQTSCNLYTKALRKCPLCFKSEVAILYSNRAAAKMKLHSSYNKSAIVDCTKSLDLNPSYLKPRLRRAAAYIAEEKLDEASEDLKVALSLEPLNREAVTMYKELQEKIAEREKKLEEMMGQLKQLGNLVLRPFGLSTENFRLNRDPATNSYSVEMVRNPSQEQR